MKVWFYYANSGGGHKAPAEAVALALKNLDPQKIEIKFVDLGAESFVSKYSLEHLYVFLTHSLPRIYKLVYKLSLKKSVIRFENWLGIKFTTPHIKKELQSDPPDIIVSTYFLVSPIQKALKELKLSIPIIIITTEPFSVPPVWFYSRELNFIVFSDEAKKLAIENGVSEEKVKKFNPILNHPLTVKTPQEIKTMKTQYGFDPNKKVILIIGGAHGLPDGVKVLRELLEADLDAQYIAICGHNDKMAQRKKKLSRQYRRKVAVLGFRKDICDIYAMSDLVISKAGAGVTWEVLFNRKPLLITHYIYGQEKGTMEYVVQSGLGWFEPKPRLSAEIVKWFLEDPLVAAGVKLRYESANLKPGNEEIAKYIYGFLDKDKALTTSEAGKV